MFRFGEGTLRQEDALGFQSAHGRRAPRLEWIDAGGTHTFVVERASTVGSAEGVDVVIADPAVSRLHAELEPQHDGLWVRDLGSRNGTALEGIRIGSACVPEGGRLRVGGTEIRVSYAPTPTEVELWPEERFGGLVGPSVAMRALFARLGRVAATDATVLIEGETGTGKELVARAVHDASARRGGPFVVVDCGALPETLLEAELFGHTRGAFTGAVEPRAGALESAEGGTVFLDEIGELSLAMQPKLLRALESRSVRRLGDAQHRPIDVRFVCATNRDLRTMVNARAFREDLYFRLAVVPVAVPPLRDRPGDIPALVEHFLAEDGRAGAVGPDLLRELVTRPWSGNVRELKNFVVRALALGPAEALAMSTTPAAADDAELKLPDALYQLPLRDVLDRCAARVERQYVQRLLDRHGRNITAAADAAGLNRTFLHRLVRRHGL